MTKRELIVMWALLWASVFLAVVGILISAQGGDANLLVGTAIAAYNGWNIGRAIWLLDGEYRGWLR